jgi:hypothetical protein
MSAVWLAYLIVAALLLGYAVGGATRSAGPDDQRQKGPVNGYEHA